MFDFSVYYMYLQYFDTVGWVFWPVKTVSHVTYTAVRIVLQVPRQSPSQPLLEELHWLPVRQRIDYKLAVIDVQDPEHINSCIPQPSHQTSGIHTSPPFFNHTTTP